MMVDNREFAITYNRNKFYYIPSNHPTKVLAWEQVSANTYEPRIIHPSQIKDAETFLKSMEVWERYEKEFLNTPQVENNLNEVEIPKRTEAVLESEYIMTKIKVESPVTQSVANGVNELIQVEVKCGRGRPKGSKNVKKD